MAGKPHVKPRAPMVGFRSGRLIVIAEAGKNSHGDYLWLCRCDCGTEAVAPTGGLRRGDNWSCGCYNRERIYKHGYAAGDNATPEYKAWINMVRRCHKPREQSYPRYGAIGIQVWPEWRHSFPAFIAYIGPRPSTQHSLDRIDNAKGYEPGNVRWATAKEQIVNRRVTVGFRTLDDEYVCLADVAHYLAIPANTFGRRLRRAGVL